MKKYFLLLSLALISLTACANVPGQEMKTDSLDYQANGNQNNPVMINSGLPVQQLVITSGKKQHSFEVEIASTFAQRKIGLMNRRSMPEKSGMLFIFEEKGYVNFWMKDTLIPLDIIFIDDNNRIRHIAHSVQPCRAQRDSDCAKYNSQAQVKYVLEINAGLTEKLGIKDGDKVTWL
jgi:uncharacterized membrane protein (UPF0127 family)